MMKFGATPDLSIGQGLLPASMQSSMTVVHGSAQDPLGSIAQFGKKIPDMKSQGPAGDGNAITRMENFRSEDVPSKLCFGTRTEKLINGLLQDPVLGGENSELLERVCTRMENFMSLPPSQYEFLYIYVMICYKKGPLFLFQVNNFFL